MGGGESGGMGGRAGSIFFSCAQRGNEEEKGGGLRYENLQFVK